LARLIQNGFTSEAKAGEVRKTASPLKPKPVKLEKLAFSGF